MKNLEKRYILKDLGIDLEIIFESILKENSNQKERNWFR